MTEHGCGGADAERPAPNRLRERRLALRMTQKEVAALAGTSYQMVGKLEKGERGLTVRWMQQLAPALSCEPADLLPDGRPAPPAGPIATRRPSRPAADRDVLPAILALERRIAEYEAKTAGLRAAIDALCEVAGLPRRG